MKDIKWTGWYSKAFIIKSIVTFVLSFEISAGGCDLHLSVVNCHQGVQTSHTYPSRVRQIQKGAIIWAVIYKVYFPLGCYQPKCTMLYTDTPRCEAMKWTRQELVGHWRGLHNVPFLGWKWMAGLRETLLWWQPHTGASRRQSCWWPGDGAGQRLGLLKLSSLISPSMYFFVSRRYLLVSLDSNMNGIFNSQQVFRQWC